MYKRMFIKKRITLKLPIRGIIFAKTLLVNGLHIRNKYYYFLFFCFILPKYNYLSLPVKYIYRVAAAVVFLCI